MSSAVDPTPYLLPGALRTAEDVLDWLDTLHKGPVKDRIFGIQDAVCRLDERLDRERRQAFRHQALWCWRSFTLFVRDYARQKREEGLICDSELEGYIESYLSKALAFRAAARTP